MLSLSHIPIISALVNNMDEGFVVYDDQGEIVFSNPVGQCCLKGHKTFKDILPTEVLVDGKMYVSKLYVIDHGQGGCAC